MSTGQAEQAPASIDDLAHYLVDNSDADADESTDKEEGQTSEAPDEDNADEGADK